MIARKNRTPFLGTPPANDIEALEKFYKNLEIVVKNILDNLFTMMEVNTEGYVDKKTALSIVNLALIGLRCGGRYIAGSTLLLDSLLERTPNTWKDHVDIFLHDLRRNIVLGMTGRSAHNAHNYTQVLKTIGLKTGMQGAVAAEYDDPYEPRLERYEIEYAFFDKYRPSKLIDKLHEKLKGKHEFPVALLIDWIKGNLPKSWEAKTTKQLRELIKCLERAKKTPEEIRISLKKNHEIDLQKGLNWEEALKRRRQYSFLEKKVYNMDSGELTRYVVRYYLLNSGYLKRAWD